MNVNCSSFVMFVVVFLLTHFPFLDQDEDEPLRAEDSSFIKKQGTEKSGDLREHAQCCELKWKHGYLRFPERRGSG